MKKKVFALFLTGALLVGMLAGCGLNTGTGGKGDGVKGNKPEEKL